MVRRLLARIPSRYGRAAVICPVRPPELFRDEDCLNQRRSSGVRIIPGDLLRSPVSLESPPLVDAVFHLAANIDTAGREHELRVNDLGTENLLRWLEPVAPGVRVIYASSVAVLDRDEPASGPVDETSPCTPRTPYGVTKLRGEQVIRERASLDGYTFTIVRLGTVYGPGAKSGGLFDALIRSTMTRGFAGRINWPGRVSVIHVEDVVSLLLDLCVRQEAANEIYCAANPEAPTVAELAERIGLACGRPVDAVVLPAWIWSLVRRLIWHPAVTAIGSAISACTFWRFSLLVDHAFWIDTTKLQSVWKHHTVTLDAGVAEMVVTLIEIGTRL
jgi:nucleoside-diphosphate-sugar epimerase